MGRGGCCSRWARNADGNRLALGLRAGRQGRNSAPHRQGVRHGYVVEGGNLLDSPRSNRGKACQGNGVGTSQRADTCGHVHLRCCCIKSIPSTCVRVVLPTGALGTRPPRALTVVCVLRPQQLLYSKQQR